MPPPKAARKQEQTDIEALLQKEYEQLTDTLNSLQRKVEQLRRENEFLESEANQTRMESQEYISYLAKRTQRCQAVIVTVSDQNHQDLEALGRQREETLATHQELANEVMKGILEKENELALLKAEMAELKEIKSLQQQQLCCIGDLEREMASMQSRHSESLQTLKSSFLSERQRAAGLEDHRAQALTLAANREASRCLLSHIREVSEENQRLGEELRVLVGQAGPLRTRQEQLQAQRRLLLTETGYVRDLCRLRAQKYK